MATLALLPLRSLDDGKRRLAGALPIVERRVLVRRLLERAIRALRESGAVDAIAIVSPDSELPDLAALHGVLGIAQHDRGLNRGLEHGRSELLRLSGSSPEQTSLLVMLPDLALLEPAELYGLLALAAPHTVLLAPDRHERGTNALVQQPADVLPFGFGPDSFARHAGLARGRGLDVREYRAPGLQFDVDTPEDLEIMRQEMETQRRIIK